MFTGLVEELGSVVALKAPAPSAGGSAGDAATSRLTIYGPTVRADARHGDSIAVNGVCLTVVDLTVVDAGPESETGAATGSHVDAGTPAGTGASTGASTGAGGTFTVDVVQETLQRTSLGALRPGDRVNLERPLRLADRLGGHLVQGHVDGVGRIRDRGPDDVMRVSLPASLSRYVVPKGSITVDGVSLTVVEAMDEWFSVALIPTTLQLTTLGHKGAGDPVNLEVDVVAKYVERMLEARA